MARSDLGRMALSLIGYGGVLFRFGMVLEYIIDATSARRLPCLWVPSVAPAALAHWKEYTVGGKHEDKDQREIEGDGQQKGREVPKDTGKGGGKRGK